VTFGREIDATTPFAILDHAIERGITLMDTAEVYAIGASESVRGKWIAHRGTRDNIVLATKVADSMTWERILESAEASLALPDIPNLWGFQTELSKTSPYGKVSSMSAISVSEIDGSFEQRWPMLP